VGFNNWKPSWQEAAVVDVGVGKAIDSVCGKRTQIMTLKLGSVIHGIKYIMSIETGNCFSVREIINTSTNSGNAPLFFHCGFLFFTSHARW
jgi:hypothetical protein